MVTVRALMAGLRAPEHYDKVFKDECVFTFDTPFSDGGLAVNLRTFQGFGADVVDLDVQRNGGQGGLYLLQKFKRVPREKPEGAVEPQKLAIGVAGGFLEEKWDVIKEYTLLVVDQNGQKTSLPFPSPELPMFITTICDAIIAHQGASSMDNVSRWEADQEVRESKYAKDLVQLPPLKKISPNPKDWRCEKSGDTQNLWLNLSDGFIGGGRKNWDGSGGSNGALDHFKEEQAKGNFFPLVVKLGTITPNGADVYSYAPDEDDLVKDPNLQKHLEHWGIDIMKMEKTDKTMAEMEVDMNLSYDWSRICESGEKLVRLRGPGQVGLKNLGNSCYMNSSLQLLLGIPHIKARYQDTDYRVRRSAPLDAHSDFVTQIAKLVTCLGSERYAPPWKEGDDEDDPKYLVAPQMLRALVGRGHPEFSSGRQQDAAEFLQYFLELLSRNERTALEQRLGGGKPTADLFNFLVEEKLQETGGQRRVKYKREPQNILLVRVDPGDAENLAELAAYKAAHPETDEKEAKKAKTEGEPEEPKPLIQFGTCLQRFAAPEEGVSFRGGVATKTVRLASMPRYLLVGVARYYMNDKWVQCKHDCKVPMPDHLDLESLRGSGLQPGEVEYPEEAGAEAAAPSVPAGPQPDQTIVSQLLQMGLSENAAKRACLGVQNANADAAASWYFEHMDDANINDPLESGPGAAPASDADPEAVAMLSSMGFSQAHVLAALKSCSNNAERAADWLFSHAEDLEAAVASLGGTGGVGAAAPAAAGAVDDGPGEYALVGFISHIGRHTSHGHYVCHMKHGSGWVIFDDQKVAQSEAPPLELGYIYLYRRKDVSA